jgi:cysteinyl-tRNA synthetase
MTTIRLHNSLTRKKEEFTPLDPKNVRMYVCGPTVYDRAHLGNARPVLVFDVLYRLLRHVYGPDHVTYVRNFTDVDDKINDTARSRKAAGAAGTLEELIAERTEETIGWYHADTDAIGALRPTHEPRATAYIGQMIEMIKTLIAKKHAYTAPISYGHNSRAVYFDSASVPEHAFFEVASFEHYGDLSGRSVDDMIAGAKSEIGEGKRNPMDFVLWKPSTVEDPGWKSPWGIGRPGWHIECSAMSKALLGPIFDIHGGGLDLQFPHHENEIAQSCCANGTSEMARYWMHNEMLQVEGKKMSKSLGNFFTVRDLLDQGVPGEVIRFVMLSTHYRSPMDWTAEKAKQAERTLRKWWSLVESVSPGVEQDFVLQPLYDDLNTVDTIQRLRSMARALEIGINNPEGTVTPENFLATARVLGFLQSGIGSWAKNNFNLAPYEQKLTDLRAKAMADKDFSAVDAMKSALVAAGVEVRMSKQAIELVPAVGFDPAKLEALK